MAITDLAAVVVGASPVLGMIATDMITSMQSKISKRKADAKAEAEKTDGRSPQEWYDILKSLGRKEYESLSRGALDGLEESDIGKWDIRPLVKGFYDKLMKEWYPERYCPDCGNEKNKNGNCMWDGPCHASIDRRRQEREVKMVRVPEDMISAYSNGNHVIVDDNGMQFVARHHIVITDLGIRGVNERGYRIRRDDRAWVAGKREIQSFQLHKGLRATGVLSERDKKILIRYLDAGNSWPVPMPGRAPLSEKERVERDLAKWKADYVNRIYGRPLPYSE
jgi:hypothetical protein